MKFGGTSMGSAERIRHAAALIREQRQSRPCVTVVSAMSGITDLLLSTLRAAESGDERRVHEGAAKFRDRHFECAEQLLQGEARAEAISMIAHWAHEFDRTARGVLLLRERPPRAVDYVAAMGEQISSRLLAAYLTVTGTASTAVSGSDLIVTDNVFGNASPLMEPTRHRARSRLLPLVEHQLAPIVTGFNGATVNEEPTTLGRGGSDFSASILASALDAAELWIWTDVDGIMSADPRLVPDARVLDEVSYVEAAELAYNGAKVLHPRTIAPLAQQRIPVWSKNSFNPAVPGTKISGEPSASLGPKAVTSMTRVALVSIEPATNALNGTLMMGRALEALGLSEAEVLMTTSSSYRQTFCFLVRSEDLTAALESLKQNLTLEITHGYLRPFEVDDNVGLIAVVGEGMKGETGLASRVFAAISREQVNIIAIAQGSSEHTIGVAVRRDGLEKAVRAIHAECGLGRT
jgi:aspartate kinase